MQRAFVITAFTRDHDNFHCARPGCSETWSCDLSDWHPMLSGLPAPCSWQESWRDEDSAVNPDGILGTGVTGMGAPGWIKGFAGIQD